ncbi:expressed unknown protein [Seminavis robusta]|uniref:PARP-type domain-containing protein n=1 Tax=Seminavis robusta TaxID=568900 RepID=A0A9N8HYZ0_9STRA|nr:expressed unknown protein [Seminavis robusta]|eukprot:Sro2122_g315510.1 n/a (255) ;mRNA; r:8829-9843
MTKWEVLNVKDNLDGSDKSAPSEENRENNERDRRRLQTRALTAFVADLNYRDAAIQAEKEKSDQVTSFYQVQGAFFAAPSSTGRAKCRICDEPIAKETIRVTHHDLYKFYNQGCGGSWDVRQTQKHYHASCFVDSCHPSDQKFKDGTDVTLENVSTDFLVALEKVIVSKKDLYEKDKDYQKLFRGPTTLSYPSNMLTFGRVNPQVTASVSYTNPASTELAEYDYVVQTGYTSGPEQQCWVPFLSTLGLLIVPHE